MAVVEDLEGARAALLVELHELLAGELEMSDWATASALRRRWIAVEVPAVGPIARATVAAVLDSS